MRRAGWKVTTRRPSTLGKPERGEVGRPRIRVVLLTPEGHEHALEAYCELKRQSSTDRAGFSPAMIRRAARFGQSLEHHDLCGRPRPQPLRFDRVEIGFDRPYATPIWTTARTPPRLPPPPTDRAAVTAQGDKVAKGQT